MYPNVYCIDLLGLISNEIQEIDSFLKQQTYSLLMIDVYREKVESYPSRLLYLQGIYQNIYTATQHANIQNLIAISKDLLGKLQKLKLEVQTTKRLNSSPKDSKEDECFEAVPRNSKIRYIPLLPIKLSSKPVISLPLEIWISIFAFLPFNSKLIILQVNKELKQSVLAATISEPAIIFRNHFLRLPKDVPNFPQLNDFFNAKQQAFKRGFFKWETTKVKDIPVQLEKIKNQPESANASSLPTHNPT